MSTVTPRLRAYPGAWFACHVEANHAALSP